MKNRGERLKIYIGADHAGFKLKGKLKSYLQKLKYNVIDLGNKKFDPKDDYPIFATKVAKAVSKSKNSFGVLICGSGQGVCIVANKVKDIRAALVENIRDACLARNDDNSNIICLQGRYLALEKAKRIVKKFFKTPFSKIKRYKRRLKEIKNLEK